MIDDDAISQYDTDDYEKPLQTISTPFSVKKGSFVAEIRLGDQTFNVISPEYIEFINRKINELELKCNSLENEIRTLKQESRRSDSKINNAINQINSRFGFNG